MVDEFKKRRKTNLALKVIISKQTETTKKFTDRKVKYNCIFVSTQVYLALIVSIILVWYSND